MFHAASFNANAYQRVAVETGVSSANPHQLILMLFDGAHAAIDQARLSMQLHDIGSKGQSITKAITIIDHGLKASLDLKAGGAIAVQLYDLYRYMCHRLLKANLTNQPEILNEVDGLLMEIRGAWEAIGQDPQVINAKHAA